MSKIPIPRRLLSDIPIAFMGPMSQNLQLPEDLPPPPGPSQYWKSSARLDARLSPFNTSYDLHPNGNRMDMSGKILIGAAFIRESEQLAEYYASQPLQKQIRDLNAHFSNIDVLLSRESVLLVLVQPDEVPSVVSKFRKEGQLALPSGIVYSCDSPEEQEKNKRQSKLAADGIHAICIARNRQALFQAA